MLNIGISSAIKSLELFLTIKSKKTAYEIYYDAKERSDAAASKVDSAVRSSSPDDSLIKLLRAELREQASITEIAKKELKR